MEYAMQEPPEPMELKLAGLYSPTHKYPKVAECISNHIIKCEALLKDIQCGQEVSSCESYICQYFRWFYPFHYKQCPSSPLYGKNRESDCKSCNKLREWVRLHSKSCSVDCPIELCQKQIKKAELSSRLTNPHIHCQTGQVNLHCHQQRHTAHTLPNALGRLHQSQPFYNGHSRDSLDLTQNQNKMSRYDSVSSIGSSTPYRTNISDEMQAIEHEPPVKPGDMTKNFPYNTSFSRSSIDSTVSRQSFSMQPPNLPIPHPLDRMNEFSSLEEELRQRVPDSLVGAQHDATLPVMSRQSFSLHPVSSHQQALSIRPSNDTSVTSHDSHMTSQDRSRDSPMTPHNRKKMARAHSPRQSEILTEKRKRELVKGANVISNSPEIIRRGPAVSGHRATSPDDENFSSLNSEDLEWDEKPQQCVHKSQQLPMCSYSNREMCSPSSDSSPGPSSLEEVKGRRPRIVQRMDTDPDELHTKILTGSGSITAAHVRIIQQGLNLSAEVKLRMKISDSENGDHTSGVSSASVSGSSIGSARSSGIGPFSELDYSSLEMMNAHDMPLSMKINHENEDSASSTIVGDHSLGSAATTHSYQQQHSSNSLPSYSAHCNNHDSGLYDPCTPGHSIIGAPKEVTSSDVHTSYPGHMDSRLHKSSHVSVNSPGYPPSPTHHSGGPEYLDNVGQSISSVNSYSSAHTGYSSSDPDSGSETSSLPEPPLLHPSLLIQESIRGVDEALVKYSHDIHIMKNRPRKGGKVPTHDTPGMSQEEKQQLQPVTVPLDKDSDYYPLPTNMPVPHPDIVAKQHEIYQEMLNQRLPDTPQEDEIIMQSIVARRDQLKQYLLGQFYSDEVYREHADWERKTKLGHGAQASCFSVSDNRTKCILVLKEETENRHTLDEAYLSLKFASQNNPSPNIVEYYTAALLPGHLVLPQQRSPFVQIFMEQMPVCLQGWLFKSGPIPLINVHHYSCQLFDALDFLHNKHGIIHCDIKPANILVDETAQRIKLTDFGSAEIIGEKRTDYTKSFSADPNAGTLSYNPPEFYRHQQCSFAFDIWQAGCCVLAMCTGRRPWRHLFMDVYPGKQHDKLSKAMKITQRQMIKEQRDGHFHPAFLDTTLKRLLYGCLHDDPLLRLTAKECSYLLNTETASTHEERQRILKAIGYTPSTPRVLQSLPSNESRVDVYLGSDKLTSTMLNHTHQGGRVHLALYGGWLGSLLVTPGMTYRQAEIEIHKRFPVAKQLGPFIMACYDNSPHTIWSACSGRDHVPPYRHTCPDALVDVSTALVLSPSTVV